jgi:hypothetical protein
MPPSSNEPTPESRTYPRKVNISNDDSFTLRGPFKLERSENSAGVASPSDPRRPHHQPEHTLNNIRMYQIEGHDVSAETFANFTEWQNKQQASRDRLEEQGRMAETAAKKRFAEAEATRKSEHLTREEAEHKTWRNLQPKETFPGEHSSNGRAMAEVLRQFHPPEALEQWKKENRDLYRHKREDAEAKKALAKVEKSMAAKMEATARETELISESLNGSSARTPSAQASAAAQDPIDSREWKQTALDRRAGSRADFTTTIRARQRRLAALHNNMPTKIRVDPTTTAMNSDVLSDIEQDAASTNTLDTRTPPPGAQFWHYTSEQSQLLDDIAKGHPTSKSAAQEGNLTRSNETNAQKTDIESSRKPAFTRSTSEVLSQLPKDDIDFLSAADIRAAMGVKKAQEEAAKSRAELEKDFREAHAKEMELDSMIESQIVNDKHIRRLERELKDKQEAKAAENETASSESILGTSLNSLTKMIQDGGECLTKYLWSDPVDANGNTTTASTKRPRDPMLGGIIQTLRQNRNTMSEISQNLGDDIPATKRLLKGLKDFESRAIGSVVSLARYRNISEKVLEAELGKKHDDALESLKLVNYRGEMYKQIEQAWKAIDSMTAVKLSKDVHERLQVAETVLEESAESTHTMWRSLIQANLCTHNSPEPLWKIMLYHIRAVSDLQNSLLKIIQRFMLHFNVPLRQKQQTLFGIRHSGKVFETTTEEDITSSTSNKLSAANRNLEEEIQSQKDAMRGLSDDGYRRASKPAPAPAPPAPASAPVKKKALDELKPLTNSLFRPFGLQLESLGKEEKVVAEERKSETQKVREQMAKEIPHWGSMNMFYEDKHGDASPTLEAMRVQMDAERASERTTAEISATATPSLTEQAVNLFLREPEVETYKTKVEALPSKSTSVDGSSVCTLEGQNEDIVGGSPTKSLSVAEREPDAPVIDVSKPTTVLASSTQASLEEPVVKSAPTPYISLASNVPETAREVFPSLVPAPTTYKILTYNPTTDELSITTTTSTLETATTAVPLPEALLALDHPGKFAPHIPEGFEVAKTRNDMLVMRSSAEAKLQTETVRYSTIASEPISEPAAATPESTTKENNDYLTKDGECLERKRDNYKIHGNFLYKNGSLVPLSFIDRFRLGLMKDMVTMKPIKPIKRRRSLGLVKTVIWAGAGCYALGVLGELLA